MVDSPRRGQTCAGLTIKDGSLQQKKPPLSTMYGKKKKVGRNGNTVESKQRTYS